MASESQVAYCCCRKFYQSILFLFDHNTENENAAPAQINCFNWSQAITSFSSYCNKLHLNKINKLTWINLIPLLVTSWSNFWSWRCIFFVQCTGLKSKIPGLALSPYSKKVCGSNPSLGSFFVELWVGSLWTKQT